MPEIIRFRDFELRFLRSKEDTAGSLDLFEMIVQPEGHVPVAHYHESWDETVYGLDGVITFRINSEDVEIGPGQTAFIERGVVHSFRNNSRQPAKCLSVLSPGVLGPAYFREMASLLSQRTPDRAKLKETMLRHGLVPVPEG